MKLTQHFSTAIVLAFVFFGADLSADIVVFDADFNASPLSTSNTDNNATTANLNTGTSIGSWAIGGVAPGGFYADSANGNVAFTIDSRVAAQTTAGVGDLGVSATGVFSAGADLAAGDTLSFGFDIFATREGALGGGVREVNIGLQDSTGADAFAVSFNEEPTKQLADIDASGAETVISTNPSAVGDFINPNVGSFPSGSVHRIQIDVTGVGVATASIDWDNDGTVDGTAALTDFAGLTAIDRFEIDFGTSTSISGAYLDNFVAEVTAVPEPGSLMIFGSLGLIGLVRRKRS